MALRLVGTSARRAFVRAAVALPVVAVAACGSDGPTSPSQPSARSLTVVLVPIDGGFQGTAVAAFADGSSRDVGAEAQWTSSNPAVATVSSTGRVTPVTPGSVEIRATYQSVSGAAPLAVSGTPPQNGPPPGSGLFRLSGSVVDAMDQQPIPGALLTLAVPAQPPVTTRSQRDGTYAFDVVPEGPVTVTADLDGYASNRIERTAAHGTRIDLALTPEPFTLEGTIIDAFSVDAGVSCEPARVEVLDGPDAGRTALIWHDADPPGRFRFPDLRPGRITLRASAPDYHPNEVTARVRGIPPHNRLEISLSRAPTSNARPRCGQ